MNLNFLKKFKMKEVKMRTFLKKTYLLALFVFVFFVASCSTNNPNEDIKTNSDTNDKTEVNQPQTEVVDKEFEGYYEVLDGVYVNYHPGVYNENIVLNFKFKDKGGRLYYSLDSSNPTTMYLNKITINLFGEKANRDYPLTTSVDAILANDTGGRCISYNYINNIQKPQNYILSDKQCVVTIKFVDSNGKISSRSLTYMNTDYTIPVISLSMPYDNWFGENGFYNKIREDISHYVNMEYFDSSYDEYFYVNSKIKLGGNWSLGYPQRTLNLNFNKDVNGNKNEKVEAHIFGERMTLGDSEKRLTKLTRFRLHNGGNCFEERTGFNDAILHNLMYGTNVSTTAYRPCVTYLNGEYWGIYSIREHYSDTYFEDNYGVDKDNVTVYELKGNVSVDDGVEEGAMEHLEIISDYLKNDFSNDEIYENFINTYIDVDSLIDCFIAHSYAGNWDFVGNYNNLKFWRTVTIDESNPYADGKIRFCLHDVDFAFSDTQNFLDPNHQNSYVKFDIYRKLLENEQFKIRFYKRAEELIATNFSYENAEEVIYKMVREILRYRVQSFRRWGNQISYTDWRNESELVLEYIKQRNETYLPMLKETLGL